MENDEQYVRQLEEIFNQFCDSENAGLNKEQLTALCKRLSLDEESANRIFSLAFPDEILFSNHVIEFDQFCECFVAILSEINQSPQSTTESGTDQEPDKEDDVTPRLVRGGRRYGRKTAPNVIEDENDDKNGSPVCNEDDPKNDNWLGQNVSSTEIEDIADYSNKLYYEPGFGDNVADVNASYIEEITPVAETSVEQSLLGKNECSIIAMSTEDMGAGSNHGNPNRFHESGVTNLFANLDVEGSGIVDVEAVVASWKLYGVEDPLEILQALQFPLDDGQIDGYDLSSALEREVVLSSGPNPQVMGHSKLQIGMNRALLASYSAYIQHVNSETDQYKNLTEKMRDDLEKSELRASKLIEEVDDRYLSMDQQNEHNQSIVERKWAKKLTSVHHMHDQERDSLVTQFNQDREVYKQEIESLRSNDKLLQKRIKMLKSENDSISRESSQFCQKLIEAEKDAERLRRDLECLLNEKSSGQSDPYNTSQEEKFAIIIKEYEAQCRHLADKNDELVLELESVHGRLKLLESHDRHHGMSESSFHDEKLKEGSSPKRKKPQRRNSNMSDVEHTSHNFSEIDNDHVFEKHDACGFAMQESAESNMRMQELERLVEDLREDKRRYMEDIAKEKMTLQSKMEKELQNRLESEKSKLRRSDDNRAVEEQQTMTIKLLKQITQEKDELESKYLSLKTAQESQASIGQQGMTDLCREFAQEKAELVASHQKQIEDLTSKVDLAERRCSDESKASERLAEQLKSERLRHNDALSAHQEVISKFERSAAPQQDDASVSERVKQVSAKYEEDLNRQKQAHTQQLKLVKDEMQQKLDQLLSEKHQVGDNTSICSELDRLNESIGAERMDMHERMQSMRESFEREAAELKQMLDCDKAKLRKQLNDEVAALRQRLAEETEAEVKRKRQIVEESEREESERRREKEREELGVTQMRDELQLLKDRNADLESRLSQASSLLQEQEEKSRRKWEEPRDAFEQKVEELNKKLEEKEQLNISLKSQVDDLVGNSKEKGHVINNLESSALLWSTERIQMQKENEDLMEKLRSLEREKVACRIENAGLNARCEKLQRGGGLNSPIPSPKTRSRRRVRAQEEEGRGRKEQEEKINEMTREIADLRTQLMQVAANSSIAPQGGVRAHDEGVEGHEEELGGGSDAESVSSTSSVALRSRLSVTRQQLNDQMKRTKDLYSKLSKSESLLGELYCENSQLMRALQVTEARQKEAERRCQDEQDRCLALGNLLKQVCPELP